jgi:hypothetical protein
MLQAKNLSALRYASAIVCLLAIPWGVSWSIGEEIVIYREKARGVGSDMPGMERYIYPGNSGAGFADGVAAPLTTLRNFSILGVTVGSVSLIPHYLGFRRNERA